MAKFSIIASPSTYCDRTEMVSTMIAHAIYNEDYEGSIDQVAERLKQVKEDLIKSKSFDHNCGFSLTAYLFRGSRKPNGFDKRRRDLCTNYINK
jgi:hypothetical protein